MKDYRYKGYTFRQTNTMTHGRGWGEENLRCLYEIDGLKSRGTLARASLRFSNARTTSTGTLRKILTHAKKLAGKTKPSDRVYMKGVYRI